VGRPASVAHLFETIRIRGQLGLAPRRSHERQTIAAPDPELEPQGFRFSAQGLIVCPPRPLQPLEERVERKLAHSLMLVFPRISAPAWRSLRAMKA